MRNYAKQWAIKCSFLQHLNLIWIQISDKGVEELSKAIVAIKCSFLQHLNLSWNQIGNRGDEELSKAMVAIKCIL